MIIDELFEAPQLCPECGGISFSDLILAEKKDACYYKVKASAKVWPSAYASGRLVQCRKKGAANYGKSKNESVAESSLEEGVNDPHIFKCIFLFGPMGAGKSTVAGPLLSHTGLRSVNLDNFNEMFIKKGQVPTGHLAPDQLEKSWQLSQTQQNNFADGRLGIIIDGSGRNPETAIGVIQKLQPLGYEFMMIFVNVSEATSIARQQSRAAKQQQQWGVGRQVDPTLAKDTYAQVQKNLAKYSAYFGPQRFVYVDNENTPDLTQATKKIDAFLRAPVTQPEALAWIQAQKGGQQVAQQQKKLATAQSRQQQALTQYKKGPLNPNLAKQGMAEQQELDEKWSQKYKSSINCANPQGFSQKAHCAGRKKNEDVAEGVMYGAENLHVGDDVIISGDVEFNGATGVIDSFGQDKRFVVVDLYNHGRHSFHSSDVSANDYDNDEHDDLDETRKSQMPMTLKPGETDNLEPEDFAGFKKLPAYQQGVQAQQKAGKQLIQKSPYTFQSDQDWAFRQGATDAQRAAMFANFGGTKPLTTEEGEQQKGADYRDPKEVDYDGEYDAMVARVKKLAGLGPMKTVYDPNKRVYRNIPTAVQPKK